MPAPAKIAAPWHIACDLARTWIPQAPRKPMMNQKRFDDRTTGRGPADGVSPLRRVPATDVGAANGDGGLIESLDSVLSLLIQSGKNRLGPIKGFASLIQDDTDEASNARRWADKIMRNVRALEDHFDSLNMFRLGGCTGVSEVSWHRVVSDVMDRFAAVNVRGVPIEISNQAPGTFRHHKVLLTRVLVHLVVNAYESIERKGKVGLAIRDETGRGSDRKRFSVWVTDTGAGIDGETMPRIWDPFFTTKTNHLGLGLPYVAAAASKMGLEIEVASGEGRGTAIRLSLTEPGGQVEEETASR